MEVLDNSAFGGEAVDVVGEEERRRRRGCQRLEVDCPEACVGIAWASDAEEAVLVELDGAGRQSDVKAIITELPKG